MLDCLADPSVYDSALPLHVVAPAGLGALLQRLPMPAAGFLQGAGFAAKAGEVLLLPGPEGLAGAVLGLGDTPDAGRSPWSFGGLPRVLPAGTAWRLATGQSAPDAAAGAAVDPDALVLGWCLGAYQFTECKGDAAPPPRAPAKLVPPQDTDSARRAAAATYRARTLVNRPANRLGPAELVAAVGEVAALHGARFEAITGAALEQGFPALAAVGAGSPRAPAVGVLRWDGPGASADAPLVALCGKGVCFDTGGLDLKPSAGMLRMKKDMGGAAIMLGLAEMIMAAKLKLRLLLLVGAVENSVSGTAMRPLDVLRTRAGITIEVGNTDAEGRIVLADLLCFAGEQKPDVLIDAATLTGAARVALGPDLPALFCNDDGFADTLLRASHAAYDPLWRLPLHGGYDSWLESSVADANTVAAKPMAGSIVAALFLQRFVPCGLRWAHVDVYAWNDATRPGRPEGGEAQAMRGLLAGLQRSLLQ